MKVLQVISGNDNGGGGVHVLNICSKVNKYFNSTICCIGEGLLFDKVQREGYNMFFINNTSSGKELIKIINENNFDIINFHGAKANFLYRLNKRKFKKPCIVTIHSDYRYDFLNSKYKKLIYTPLSINSLKSYNYFICVSGELKQLLTENNFKGDKWVINNGISFDLDYSKYTGEREKIRKFYKISEEDFVYIYVARMHPIKNHKKLLDAFSRLVKNIENVKLLLIGDGPLMESLVQQCGELGIQNNVVFTGYQKDTLKFIDASDIGILASFNEGGMPTLTILENAIMKKTMICSNIGSLNDIFTENIGYLINPNSEEDMAAKMKQSYNERANLKKMGEEFYIHMREQYSLEKFHESYYNVYKAVLERNDKNQI